MRRVLFALLFALVAVPAAAEGPLVVSMGAFYGGPVIIENRTFTATGPGQTAIVVSWPDVTVGIAETSVILRNVTIKAGFANGVHLINAWNARLDGVNIDGGYYGAMQNGIILQGQSHDVRIDAATIMHAVTGLYIPEASEGTVIRGSTFLGVLYGIFAASDYAGRPWLNVSDSHIAASKVGIFLVNRKQVTIHDTLIYRHLRGYVPGESWAGVVSLGNADTVLRDVFIDCAPDGLQAYQGPVSAVYADRPLLRSEIHAAHCE